MKFLIKVYPKEIRELEVKANSKEEALNKAHAAVLKANKEGTPYFEQDEDVDLFGGEIVYYSEEDEKTWEIKEK